MPRSTDDPAGDRDLKRLEALRAYAILDTDREPEFDDIVAMAARACGTPMAHIAFLDDHRQWFKAEIGIGRRELPAAGSLCAIALGEDEILVVPDIAALPGAAPAVGDLGPPIPRFYAGVPLRSPEGVAIGTLCVLDRRPRELDEQQLFILKALGRSVMAQLDLRRAVAERDRALDRERRAEAERRAAARSLRDSRERSDAALASGLVGFVDWDAYTGLVRGDARFAGFVGIPAADAAAGVGPDRLLTRIDAEDRDRVQREVGAAFGEGTDFVTEFRLPRDGGGGKGGARWLLLGGRCYRAEDGAPLRLTGLAVDVTASRSAEAERDAERLRLKAVLEAAPVGILFAEAPSGRIVGQNPRADRIFGHGLIPTDAMEQHRDWILYAPDRTRLEVDRYPLVRAIARGETSAGEEYLYRRGDDALAWVQLTAAPIRDSAGGIAGGVVCIEDIGARKEAEDALRRLNGTLEAEVAARTHELDSIWRHARDMLCVARLDGTFARLNPAWAETLGRTPDELLDTPSTDLVHPDDRWRTTSALALLAEGLTVPSFENRYRHRDGSYRWFSWSAVPHEGLIYCIVRDVTAEKEAAAALAKAEEQLRQSQKMEAVGQLTGGIAHDFNNLLTGITGALDLLQRRIAQGRIGDVGRYVDIAVGSADRAAALTHRLLAFSRRQPLDPRPTDVGRLVREIEDLLRRTTGEAISFQVSLAEDLWPTLCDPHQLENALLNLVINARDAMPEGGRLMVETANLPRDAAAAAEVWAAAASDGPVPRDCVALTVADTGGGMAPEVLARAFDPFFTTKPMGQGTGLGLSMVYGFVRQSEGRVAIDSAPGRGTRVRILLPRFAGAAAAEAARPGPAAALHAPASETVLVVEDELSVRDLVVEVLADLGYRALQAPDGPAGLEVLQGGERIDLLVTDVGLPGMNGRQLAEQGRRLRPDLKVLFITGYAEDATFGEGHLDPGLQMLTKPFTIDALAGRIRAMIGEDGGAAGEGGRGGPP